MEPAIRLLIVDDHSIVREGLRAVIGREQDLEIVGEAGDGFEAVALARQTRPDAILMDLLMPRKGGLEAIEEILHDDPEAHILVLTSFAEVDKIMPAIKLGALGYIIKNSNPQDLIRAIRDVAHGAVYMAPDLARQLFFGMNQQEKTGAAGLDQLSQREIEILKLVAQGMTNEEIGAELFISGRTVGVHISHILNKLDLTNRTQAALFALRAGLVSLFPNK